MTSAAATALAVLILDQLSKLLALQRLPLGRPVSLIDGFFSLTLVLNPGLAFGMLADTPAGWRWVVALLSIGALAVLAVVGLRMLPGGGPLTPVALGFIFGGAVGNLIDRIGSGHVTDFIELPPWPPFNVADVCITFGVVLLVLIYLREGVREERARKQGEKGG